MKAQVNVVGNQRHLVSIALQKEAKATLVRTKQGIMLLPSACKINGQIAAALVHIRARGADLILQGAQRFA